jgi:hypothetical protein
VKLDAIDVSGLTVHEQKADVRRDMHVFVDYVRTRDVKRAHRDNTLSKADARRLAKLMSDPLAAEQVEEGGSSDWVDYVDCLARELGFVSYDTKGEYAGYTSSELSFPDNYIQFVEGAYQKYIALSPAKQESRVLAHLLSRRQGGDSEFFAVSQLGLLNKFSTFGSATGVVPLLDFAAARRFLLELLAQCPPGQWFSTASLIGHLKKQHRYFLIPEKPRFKNKYDAERGRYGNFAERDDLYGRGTPILETDADAFERVEGRYIERFLEDIPWVMKYVDVALGKLSKGKVYPSLGTLRAFRVNGILSRALREQIAEPRVTVTPSFEVYIQGETYPVKTLAYLSPLCEMVKEDTSFVLKMTKQKVAAARAADPQLDVVALLQRLSGTDLPANVLRELSAWSEHGEKFVLYSGFSLLETEKDLATTSFTTETLMPGIQLVHSPGKLFHELERQELIPMRVKHPDAKLSPLPKSVRSHFPKQSAAVQKPAEPKAKVTLMRVTRIQLVCPDHSFFDDLLRQLVEAKCPVEADRAKLQLSYSKSNEAEVTEAIRTLKKRYQIKIDDVG